MAGKTFNNYTHRDIRVTLFIRASENPANNAGQQRFDLSSGQGEYIGYGDDVNIYLNGISIVSIADGSVEGEQEIIITRGGDLDNQLNMNDTVNISFPGGGFQINTSNSG